MRGKIVVFAAVLASILVAGAAVAGPPRYYRGYPAADLVIDGVGIVMEPPPIIMDGRTLVPMRIVSEKLGATVEWDQSNWRVVITTRGGTACGGADEYQRGWQDGYEAGIQGSDIVEGLAYKDGYEAGRRAGFNEGYQHGYEAGYQARASLNPGHEQIGVYDPTGRLKQVVLDALGLLREKAPEWYRYVNENIHLVYVTSLSGASAQARFDMGHYRLVELSDSYYSTDPARMAGTLVHEATHLHDWMTYRSADEVSAYANARVAAEAIGAQADYLEWLDQKIRENSR